MVRKMQKKTMLSTTPDYNVTAESPSRHDRVRYHTNPTVNGCIDQATADSIRLYSNADKHLITQQIEKLDHEWDMERLLEANASSIVLLGVLMAAFVNVWWLLLPLVVAGFLLFHAIEGWCPPVSILRHWGVRTRKEIERERYALKLLRGDFDSFHSREAVDPNAILQMLDE
jgi:Inner membrane protein YgaP-like, transmembrane domain